MNSAELGRWMSRLSACLHARRHRCLVWVTSDVADALALAATLPTCWSDRLLVGGSHELPGWTTRHFSSLRDLLGGEFDCVIWDAHAGFDPDGFGQVAGMIRAGGALLLWSPPPQAWLQRPDPAMRRILADGDSLESAGTRYLTRLVGLLGDDPWVLRLTPGQPLPDLDRMTDASASTTASTDTTSADTGSTDQATAVRAIVDVWRGRARRPLVLTADRGRGKSAALGLAAAAVVAQSPGVRIVVTAPQRDQCQMVFRHAGAHPPRYLPPLTLVADAVDADLLLVDEAAGLSTAVLQRLLERFPRIVFATTVHGYEGHGRGFAIRFRSILDTLTPAWRRLWLAQPIRWAPDDPLEAVTDRALLLSAMPDPPPTAAEPVCVRVIDRDQLVADASALQPLYGLLVQAHYRTQPMDLRHLLDAPNLLLRGVQVAGRWVAIALVAAEGRFSRPVAEAIWCGQRRPRGHLLAQGLAAHAGLREAARLPVWRIMRIAVHPGLQGRGLGTRLLTAIADEAQTDGQALVGASFGATPALLRFWHGAGHVPVRIGMRRDGASGCHSVIVIHALDRRGCWAVRRGRARLRRELPLLLPDALQSVDAEVVVQLLAASGRWAAPAPADCAELRAFAEASRAFEACLPALHALSWWALSDDTVTMQAQDRALLVMRVLQARRWSELAVLPGMTGRAAVLAALRKLVADLLRMLPPTRRADAACVRRSD